MNLAFPALLIILYALPGIVFVNSLLVSSRRLSGSLALDWSTQIAYGTVLALPLHWVWLTISNRFPYSGSTPSLFDALSLLVDKAGTNDAEIIRSIDTCRGAITLYFTTITLFAFPLGRLLGTLLLPLDIFSFSKTQWDQLFKAKHNNNMFVSAVVERGSTAYLYVGLCFDRIVDEKGVLRGLWLKSPRRRALGADIPDNPQAEVFYSIDASVLFLATDKVQTMSFQSFEIPYSEEVKRVAFSLWQERKDNPDKIGSEDHDWKRAELLCKHRKDMSRGWHRWVTRLPGVQKKRAQAEEQIKNMAPPLPANTTKNTETAPPPEAPPEQPPRDGVVLRTIKRFKFWH